MSARTPLAALEQADRILAADGIHSSQPTYSHAFAAIVEGGAVLSWTAKGESWDAMLFAEKERNERPLFPVSREGVDRYIKNTGDVIRGEVAIKTENGWLLTTIAD